MVMKRMADGEVVQLDSVKPDVLRRIEMIGKLNDRREKYRAAGDWGALLKLAEEYDASHMPNMAGVIRKEAEEHGNGATVSPEHRRTIQADGAANDKGLQRKRKANVKASRHSHGAHGVGRVVQTDVSRGGTSAGRVESS